MTIELACRKTVPKPWGAVDLGPWSKEAADQPVGEIWFERPGGRADDTELLLKILFTEQKLSIQVHPDDRLARAAGLERGKTEAWYMLSARPDAEIVVGMKEEITKDELREAITDGSLLDLVAWHPVHKDDLVYIPAGTVHTIGAGLVIAEIQQRSDVTYRLFDYGRDRELHVDEAVEAVNLSYRWNKTSPETIGLGRSLLVRSPHFVIERLELMPRSRWEFSAQTETWIFVIDGSVRIDDLELGTSDAIYVEADEKTLDVGPNGLKALMFYCKNEPDLTLAARTEVTEKIS